MAFKRLAILRCNGDVASGSPTKMSGELTVTTSEGGNLGGRNGILNGLVGCLFLAIGLLFSTICLYQISNSSPIV